MARKRFAAEEIIHTLREAEVALTTHVLHRTKYYNTAVPEDLAFVFTDNGHAVGESAATLRELAAAATRVSPVILAHHNQHHDFFRWIDLAVDGG